MKIETLIESKGLIWKMVTVTKEKSDCRADNLLTSNFTILGGVIKCPAGCVTEDLDNFVYLNILMVGHLNVLVTGQLKVLMMESKILMFVDTKILMIVELNFVVFVELVILVMVQLKTLMLVEPHILVVVEVKILILMELKILHCNSDAESFRSVTAALN